ncbi:MAG: heme o synthase [Gemmatales bacterium]|nr:heme o synthase [Gemmatales bacterium]MDW8221407.1 heme o synthase [Gemmatales bacterium]
MKLLLAPNPARSRQPAKTEVAPAEGAQATRLSRWADWCELAKVRLNAMVLCSAALGYMCGSAWQGNVDWSGLVGALLGTALLAAGSAVMNQYQERELDALMERTGRRPLPTGRVRPETALRMGVIFILGGLAVLISATTPLAALLGAITVALYLGVYTPLKTRTTLNTLVGAVAGALPPLIGWSAATGQLDSPAWSLFLIQFLWQFPHFWSIAWLYRDDYDRAGMKMVPVLDATGHMTGRLLVNHSLVLTCASFSPVLVGLTGTRYLIAAVGLGAMFVVISWWFLLRPEKKRARYVLWMSLIYLPMLYLFLIADGAWAVLTTPSATSLEPAMTFPLTNSENP